jgi:hypothetical protein
MYVCVWQDLVSSFPDCSIVWTHRNPVECVASACSLHETLLRMVMEENSIDAHAIGRYPDLTYLNSSHTSSSSET